MKHLRVVQIGYGTVGGAVLEQIAAHRAMWRDRLRIDVSVVAIGGRDGAIQVDFEHGIGDDDLRNHAAGRRNGAARPERVMAWDAVIHQAAAAGHTVVMDAAAGPDTATFDAVALEQGAGVVLSNKAPLALPARDPRSEVLWSHARSSGHLRYEATVGAGLPVISTLHTLLDTGDQPRAITGMLSGTFGAIFSDVAAGTPFATAVRTAKDAGFTEPDPRDDLSGLDVARKALILARTCGYQVDLDGIEVRSFVPEALAGVSVEAFLDGLQEANAEIASLSAEAVATDAALKYVASVMGDGSVTVGLEAVPTSTVLGALTGPENVVSFRTDRYDEYPTVVSGPGAGAAVTAAGMTGDLLRLASVLG